jgi:hypothetical protein
MGTLYTNYELGIRNYEFRWGAGEQGRKGERGKGGRGEDSE